MSFGRMPVSEETARLAEVCSALVTFKVVFFDTQTISIDSRVVQPDAPGDVKLEAWYMDSSSADQRLPHRYGLDFQKKSVSVLLQAAPLFSNYAPGGAGKSQTGRCRQSSCAA